VNEDKSLAEVHDSKYKSLPMTAVDQILQLIQSEQDSVTINCSSSTSLWHGDSPASKIYKQNVMWQHIMECFEVGQMIPFPLNTQKSNDSQGVGR